MSTPSIHGRHDPKLKRGMVRPIARSRTLSRIAIAAILVGIYGAVPMLKEYSDLRDFADIPSEIHAALSLVLGCLLVFRTNTAYNRWWQARLLWGDVVAVSRSLAAKLALMVSVPEDELRSGQRALIAFGYALRDQLREGADINRLPDYEDSIETTGHVPSWLVARLYGILQQWKIDNWIDGAELRVIDADLRRLNELCSGCESIRFTRMASSYRVFARQCVALFLVTLPWGISTDFGWWTIPLTAITAYFMIGLEVVAEHVEEPFGQDEDDLNLDRLCAAISHSVTEIVDQGLAARDQKDE